MNVKEMVLIALAFVLIFGAGCGGSSGGGNDPGPDPRPWTVNGQWFITRNDSGVLIIEFVGTLDPGITESGSLRNFVLTAGSTDAGVTAGLNNGRLTDSETNGAATITATLDVNNNYILNVTMHDERFQPGDVIQDYRIDLEIQISEGNTPVQNFEFDFIQTITIG